MRYYGFFSYNGANVGFKNICSTIDLFTYRVRADLLYNIFERSYTNKSLNLGLFSGIKLARELFSSTLKKTLI
ncbi:outer membrane protein [Helicobacter cetorum MIT 99-5656]|uniref:Outer membrane protein n=1 Tax=Helicobacter cetorum (strain ATCC BAA-540 / CCUG 52418 / MIT 99-5656) TaxID=1163745 RepID=I0EQL9_HELCM|nr:outer membrane protein [Helicobacter cetorum MIT 99-5656]